MTRVHEIVIGLAMMGMFFLIGAAAAFGADSPVTYGVALLFIGPFMAYGIVFCLAFALSVALYGDPDRLVDRLLGGPQP